ncbi:MAG: NAD+ synthase [Thermoplasmata archaeon]
MKEVRVALCQMNTRVGDIRRNAEGIREWVEEANAKGAHLAVFPELTLTGYPPKDLLEFRGFVAENLEALKELAAVMGGTAAVVGFVDESQGLRNAAALLWRGNLVGVQHKTHLPTYDVFDEDRYFRPAEEHRIFRLNGVRVGITVCEDIWVGEEPTATLRRLGVDLLVNVSASPFQAGKVVERERLVASRAQVCGVPLVYVNQVGGQDDLVFDGGSMIGDGHGGILHRAKRFEEELAVVPIHLQEPRPRGEPPIDSVNEEEETYKALLLGTRDYLWKNGFQKAVVGLSGGIDSSLTAAIAVDALGEENVWGLAMPSRYSSPESIEDAEALARNLGIRFVVIPIDATFDAYLEALGPLFEGQAWDSTEENLQARIRGNILMAVSNKFRHLVLSTGNKSEMAVGYCTLYGDLSGGLAVISDVPKTMVYRLARYRNSLGTVIPERVFRKPPSAELRPDQRDEDDLPAYEVLDEVLQAYVEERLSADEVISRGFERDLVCGTLNRVNASEYKRKQAPLGLKVTSKAFGSGRVMPITNGYRFA